jgi:hypothetical protein
MGNINGEVCTDIFECRITVVTGITFPKESPVAVLLSVSYFVTIHHPEGQICRRTRAWDRPTDTGLT